jgi:hypothetical protein
MKQIVFGLRSYWQTGSRCFTCEAKLIPAQSIS